jgi:DNA modification methylase
MSLLLANATAIPLADESVQCVVTSPPYWGLRDYGVPGQLGLERTPEEYVANMVAVFREVRRVLRRDGTLWLNLGDSYYGSWGNSGNRPELDGQSQGQRDKNGAYIPRGGWDERRERPASSFRHESLKPKDLVGIPWRVAFALQADGWWLRQDIIWAKPNPMPESVTDRCTKSHEYMFLLSKSARYFYDAEAVKERVGETVRMAASFRDLGVYTNNRSFNNSSPAHKQTHGDGADSLGGRNLRSVWHIATQPYKEAHFATFPEKLVEPCILAGTSERGACSQCGAPWERVVSRPPNPSKGTNTGEDLTGGAPNMGGNRQTSAGLHRNGTNVSLAHLAKTLGWEPTCSCGAATKPCVVLDPFCGSGTVGVVCARFNREFVGLDISEKYLELARQRIGEIPYALPFHLAESLVETVKRAEK